MRGVWCRLSLAARLQLIASIAAMVVFAISPARAADEIPAVAQPPKEAATNLAAKPGFDIDGDPLPPGVVARLGSKAFRSGQEKRAQQPDQICFLPDNKTLVQATGEGRLEYRDATSGRLLRQSEQLEKGLSAASASADGRLIAAGGWQIRGTGREVTNWFKLIESNTGKVVLEWELFGERIQKLTLSPNGRTVAWQDRENVHVFDVDKRAEVASRAITPSGIAGALTFSPDGKLLAFGEPGKLLLWNWAGNSEPRVIPVPGDPRISPTPVAVAVFSPDGTQLALAHWEGSGTVLYDVASGALLRTFRLPEVERWNIKGIAISPDGKRLAVPIDDHNGGGVALWELQTGKLVQRLSGMVGSASCLAFSADRRLLAVFSSWDLTMCVWNLSTGKPLNSGNPGHSKPPLILRFFDHDKQLASAGDDATIRIWNVDTTLQQRVIAYPAETTGHSNWVRAIDVSPDDKYVVASSLDDTVRMWEVVSGREVYRLPGHGNTGGNRAVRFTPDGKQFVSWGDDMRVYEWDVATGKAVQEFRAQPKEVPPDTDTENGIVGRPFAMNRLSGACFSADAGTLFMSMNQVYRFSVSRGEELPKIEAGGGVFSWISASPDNRFLLVTGNSPQQQIHQPDGSVKNQPATTHSVQLWNLAENKIASVYESPGSFADRIAFSRDGNKVAMTVVGDHPRAEIRKIPDLAPDIELELPSRAAGVEFSASGKRLAISIADGTVLVFDLDQVPHP